MIDFWSLYVVVRPSVVCRLAKYSDFGPIERYIAETVQDRS